MIGNMWQVTERFIEKCVTRQDFYEQSLLLGRHLHKVYYVLLSIQSLIIRK